jgi:anti-sigma regulatory factor (Ser/Thr protein kinase)
MTIDLKATPGEVMRAVRLLEDVAREHGVPEKLIFGLALALEECGSNVVNHALQRDPSRHFQVNLEPGADAFVIELRDSGPAFDPTTVAERPMQAEDDDLPGGWGIHLVRRYVDEIRYKRSRDMNILRLTKRLESGGGGP